MRIPELEKIRSAVSHDLRAPLRAITGYSNIIKEDYRDDLPEEVLYFMDKITHLSSKLNLQMNGIVSYLQMSNMVLEKSFIDINVVLKSMKNIQDAILEIDCEKKVHGDVQLITILVEELIKNSIRFCQTIPKISLTTKEENNKVELTVSDNSFGIEDGNHDFIFDLYMTHPNHKEVSGSGVGLFLCKEIMERHDGSIQSRVNKDGGLKITCFFPTVKN